jgi:glycosyltransferase involved in cell wall biosynthesis
MRKQIYSPEPIILHDYATNKNHLEIKKSKQAKSRRRQRKKFPDYDYFLQGWTKLKHRNDLLLYKNYIKDKNLQKSNKLKTQISICIPTYNRTQYLKETIQNALNQDYDNFEIVIVDDGSTDNTKALVQSFQSDKIRYIQKAHEGAPQTRNRCIQEARGKYILWLDSDDLLEDGVVAAHCKATHLYPDVDVHYGDIRVFGDNSKTGRTEYRYENYYQNNAALISALTTRNRIPNPGTLIKKSLFKKTGTYNESFTRAHDYEFWTRAANIGVFRHLGRYTLHYRWHDSNMSSDSVAIDRCFESKILSAHLKRHSLEKLFPQLDWKDRKNSLILSELEIAKTYAHWQDTVKTLLYYRKALKGLNPDIVTHIDQYHNPFEAIILSLKQIIPTESKLFLNSHLKELRNLNNLFVSQNSNHSPDANPDILYSQAMYKINNSNNIESAIQDFDYILETLDPLHYKTISILRQLEINSPSEWLKLREQQFLEKLHSRPFLQMSLASAQFHNSPIVMNFIYNKLRERKNTEKYTNDNELISFIVPCFNGKEKIFKTVTSVLNQSYKNWELIIVDDGSTDSTWNLLSAINQKDPRITIHKLDINHGVSHARNTGFDISSGKFIVFLDCGDEITSDYLVEMIKVANENPDAQWIYPVTLQIGEVNRLWSFTEFDINDNLTRNVQPVTSLIRRDLLERLKGFSTDFHHGYEDWNLWITAIKMGAKGKLCQKILFIYNKEPLSRNNKLQAIAENEYQTKLLLIQKNQECYRNVTDHNKHLLKNQLRIPLDLVNIDFANKWLGNINKCSLNASKNENNYRILFYFFKNVHIPILVPIYKRLKQKYPDVEIAFGYMEYSPQIRAGFTGEELKILENFGEKMYAAPQDFNPDITFIADSVYPWVKDCGKLVHVGHGVLSKGQYYTNTETAQREEQADLVCVPGSHHERIMRQIITTPVTATGMAKLDSVFNRTITKETALKQFSLPANYRYILFAPTFNDELSAIPFVMDKINEVIPDNNTIMIIKLHGSAKHEYKTMYKNLVQKDQRVIFADEHDITPFLALCDIMISDVSSAMMEFAALDKPLILFNNPNWKSYQNYNPNDIEFEWRDIGLQVTSLEEMKNAVIRSLENPKEFSDKRKLYTDQLFANKYGDEAAERIIEAAMALLSDTVKIKGAA